MKELTPAEKRKITIAKNKAAKALEDAPSLDVPVMDAAIPVEVDPVVEASQGVDPVSLFQPPIIGEQARETQLLDVINGIMSTDNMNVKTVLEDKHIVEITKGHIFAARYNSKTMAALIQVLSETRVSKGGLGRKNLVKAITSIVHGGEDGFEDDPDKTKRRLFGGGDR